MFQDGSIPPTEVIQQFVELCDSRFGPDAKNPKATISVQLLFVFYGRFIARLD